MKKNLTRNQLESMIAECVGNVIEKSRQANKTQQQKRKKLNEAQMRGFIQNIINEEMEKEGFFRNLRDAGKDWANHAWNNGLKGSGEAAANTFKTQQQTDKDIKSYNKNYGQYQSLQNKAEELKQQKAQIEQKLQQIYSQLSAQASKMGASSRQMGSERFGTAKTAGRQGMDASQYRQSKQQGAAE